MTREEGLAWIKALAKERGFYWTPPYVREDESDTHPQICLDGRFYASDLRAIAAVMECTND